VSICKDHAARGNHYRNDHLIFDPTRSGQWYGHSVGSGRAFREVELYAQLHGAAIDLRLALGRDEHLSRPSHLNIVIYLPFGSEVGKSERAFPPQEIEGSGSRAGGHRCAAMTHPLGQGTRLHSYRGCTPLFLSAVDPLVDRDRRHHRNDGDGPRYNSGAVRRFARSSSLN